jgi:O-antigen biosynthesis protein
MSVSVIIPAYKKTEMFLEHLKQNLAFLPDCEIIVVNDDPTQSMVSVLKPFPQIILIENEKNLGFGETVNKGVKRATSAYIMLLNTDVKLLDTSWKKAVVQLEKDSNLFGVSFAQKEKDGQIVGKNRIFWEKGFFHHSKAKNLEAGITGWAEGGSCILDKKKFLHLNGFDPLYSPFYWEDIDLSYRAWKSGFTVLFNPDIVVEHHHESTIGSYFHKQFVQTTAYRNQFIFIWKNITDMRLLLSHKPYLFYQLMVTMSKGDMNYCRGLFQAVTKIPEIISARKNSFKKSDKEILGLFK